MTPALTDDLKAGAEVEFDVVDEGGGRGPALYRYEPRTGARLLEWVTSDIMGFGPLEPLLQDISITEVMVNGP